MPKNTKTDVSILKSIWTLNADGKWVIHEMHGIDIKPRSGSPADFFKIEPDIALLSKRPGPLKQNLFASFGTTEFLLRQSIVPIVAWHDGDPKIRCIGTGFFISATGLLLTAAHVIRDPVEGKYAKSHKIAEGKAKFEDGFVFGVILPANPALKGNPFFRYPKEIEESKMFVCPFEWTTHWGKNEISPVFSRDDQFKLDVDIAVCKVRSHDIIGPFQPLNIGNHNLKIGDRAVAIGYAEMDDITIGNIVDPELLVSTGHVTSIFLNNSIEKNNSTPGPNFGSYIHA